MYFLCHQGLTDYQFIPNSLYPILEQVNQFYRQLITFPLELLVGDNRHRGTMWYVNHHRESSPEHMCRLTAPCHKTKVI